MAETEKNQQSWITDDGWEYQYTDGELTITAEPGSLFVGSGLPKSDPVQIKLSAQAAYDLLEYLNQHRDEMWNDVHPEGEQATITLGFINTPSKAWQEETPEQFADGISETSGDHPLPESERDWQKHPDKPDRYCEIHNDEWPPKPKHAVQIALVKGLYVSKEPLSLFTAVAFLHQPGGKYWNQTAR